MDRDAMKTLAILCAYAMIAVGAAIITYGVTTLPAPADPYPNVQLVRVTPDPSPWIQRYAALVALAANNAYETERS
jgi:hypothetical protein